MTANHTGQVRLVATHGVGTGARPAVVAAMRNCPNSGRNAGKSPAYPGFVEATSVGQLASTS